MIEAEARDIVDLREDRDERIESLSRAANEAKLLMIWDQDADARELLERHGLGLWAPRVASLAAGAELERGHFDNARAIARRHGFDLSPIALGLAQQLERDGFGDHAGELLRSFASPEAEASPPPEPTREDDDGRAARLACEHFLAAGVSDRALEIARKHDLLEDLRPRLTAELEGLLRDRGGPELVIVERHVERASRIASACGLEDLFRRRVLRLAARALIQGTIRRERSEVTAADFAWRWCGASERDLRALAPLGLLATVSPSGDELEADGGVEAMAEAARAALIEAIDHERSPRALSELAGQARSCGEDSLARRAVERACARYLETRRELEPAEAAEEMEACLELIRSFELDDERERKVAAACARLWLLVDPGRAAEVARAHDLRALMRVSAAKLLRRQLEALELDDAEVTAQRFDLRREAIVEVVEEVVAGKAAAGAVLDALRLSRAFGVGEQSARAAATALVEGLDEEADHDQVQRALEVAVAAGFEDQRRSLATRLFRLRYRFSRLLPSYGFLLDTMRLAVEHQVVAEVGEELDEGLVRLLAFHASQGTLERFDRIGADLGLGPARVDHLVGCFLDRVRSSDSPWHAAVVAVARRYDREGWITENADVLVENALVHGALDAAAELAAGEGHLCELVDRTGQLIA